MNWAGTWSAVAVGLVVTGAAWAADPDPSQLEEVTVTAAAINGNGAIAQKERWVPELLTMEKVGAWAITEPNSGSDAFGSMLSTARANLSVGPPYDVGVYRPGAYDVATFRIQPDSPLIGRMRETWERTLLAAVDELPAILDEDVVATDDVDVDEVAADRAGRGRKGDDRIQARPTGCSERR